MDATARILALWIAFGATHIGLSSAPLRSRLVSALGERGFGALYSLVSFATFVPLVWVYMVNRHTGPQLWYLGGLPGVRWIAYLGMGFALVLIAAGVARPSPLAMGKGDPKVAGILRITRHPVFMGMGLFGLFHLFAAPVNASELAFFGGFPLFVLLGALHQDRRKLLTGDEALGSFHRDTPFLPFPRPAASAAALREDGIAALIGVVVAVVLRALHPMLFGG
jgi:uncharacterized membrane protein